MNLEDIQNKLSHAYSKEVTTWYASSLKDADKEGKFDIFAGVESGEADFVGETPVYDFDDAQTMFSFLDAKVKNDVLYKMLCGERRKQGCTDLFSDSFRW